MEQLIQEICDIKQSYTQIGGKFHECDSHIYNLFNQV